MSGEILQRDIRLPGSTYCNDVTTIEPDSALSCALVGGNLDVVQAIFAKTETLDTGKICQEIEWAILYSPPQHLEIIINMLLNGLDREQSQCAFSRALWRTHADISPDRLKLILSSFDFHLGRIPGRLRRMKRSLIPPFPSYRKPFCGNLAVLLENQHNLQLCYRVKSTFRDSEHRTTLLFKAIESECKEDTIRIILTSKHGTSELLNMCCYTCCYTSAYGKEKSTALQFCSRHKKNSCYKCTSFCSSHPCYKSAAGLFSSFIGQLATCRDTLPTIF